MTPDVRCDTCGRTFGSWTAHNAHECERDVEPIGDDLFGVEELKQRRRRARRDDRWLERHGRLR